MLWNKKTIIIGFGILCSVFVSVLSSCASYAISDITTTIQSGGNHILCAPASWRDWPSCDGYQYLIFEDIDSSWSSSGSINFSVSSPNFGDFRSFSGFIYVLSYSFSDSDYIRFSAVNFSSGSFKVTLSDSLSSLVPVPSGNLDIIQNGQYDVTNYATATVNVPQSIISEGQYHDDLVSINNSILICAAVCLVIYFFYCIYRMIIKGVK